MQVNRPFHPCLNETHLMTLSPSTYEAHVSVRNGRKVSQAPLHGST